MPIFYFLVFFAKSRPFRGHFYGMAFHEKTFRGSSQDAVVGKRILFSHDIVSNLTAWKNEK